jgi:hypothetical protein
MHLDMAHFRHRKSIFLGVARNPSIFVVFLHAGWQRRWRMGMIPMIED